RRLGRRGAGRGIGSAASPDGKTRRRFVALHDSRQQTRQIAGGGGGTGIAMARRRTFLLALLLISAFLFGGFCHLRMKRLKEEAQIARDNLLSAQAALAEIRRWKASPGRAAAVAMEAPQLSATLRQAALAAGLPDAPGSEPGSPTRLAG